MIQELPHVQAGFTKGRGFRAQIANIRWIIEKAKEFRNTSASASLACGFFMTEPPGKPRSKHILSLMKNI